MTTTASEPRAPSAAAVKPEHTLPTGAMTRDAIFNGLRYNRGWMAGIVGHDFTRFSLGRRPFAALAHPDYADHVLHAGRERYHKSIEYEAIRAATGASLFTDEDDSWRRHRSLLTPMFAKRRLNGLVPLMCKPIETLCDQLEAAGPRVDMDMHQRMVDLTLDVVGSALFSQSFPGIAGDTSRIVTSGLRSFERAERLLLVNPPPVWLFRAYIRLLYSRRIRLPYPLSVPQKVLHAMDQTVWGVINERRENPIEEPDLLNHLLSIESEDGRLPLRRVRNEALTFMLAGHETTANALSWMWYLLALNTSARERMFAELDEVLAGRPPTLDDISRLPWTQACFEEAMRYFSPAWIIPRIAIEDDVIDGHRISRGTTAIIAVNQIHHDQRWWPQPDEYDPSRFMPGADRDRHRSAYLPFGGGRRICIGTSFALMEGVLVAAMLSQRFSFELVPGHVVEPETTMTIRPRHGLRMVARPRSTAKVAEGGAVRAAPAAEANGCPVSGR